MKKMGLWLALAAMLTVSGGCILAFFELPKALTVTNATGMDIDMVVWDNNGVDYNFGHETVYDNVLGYEVYGIKNGKSETLDIDTEGGGFIYFYYADYSTRYRSTTLALVNNGQDTTYILTPTNVVAVDYFYY